MLKPKAFTDDKHPILSLMKSSKLYSLSPLRLRQSDVILPCLDYSKEPHFSSPEQSWPESSIVGNVQFEKLCTCASSRTLALFWYDGDGINLYQHLGLGKLNPHDQGARWGLGEILNPGLLIVHPVPRIL